MAHIDAEEHTGHGHDQAAAQYRAVSELGGEHASDRAECQTDQSVRGQRGEGDHSGAHARTDLGILGQSRNNAVHDGEHAGHGEQGGQQQAPGTTLLEVMGGDHRSLLTLLNVPEDDEQHSGDDQFHSDQTPVRGAKLLDFVDGQVCGEEGSGQRDHTGPIHLRSLGSGGFLGIDEHQHNGQNGNADHDPENGTEAEGACEPTTEDGVDTADATVDGSQDGHQLGVLLVFGDLGMQHDQGHRHDWAGNALDHTADHQHRHVDCERGNHATGRGQNEDSEQDLLTSDQIAKSGQEQ